MVPSKRKSDHRRDDQTPSCSQQKRYKITEEENESKKYTAGGLTRSLHGNIYQLRLLMLFLWRAVCNQYSFNLATEMEEAEKFDDIVFSYKDDKTGVEVYRFLQAKHKQDEKKKIIINDLLTENDGDFSLQKYFISFCKIRKNKKFEGYNLKDFIICTNIDLHEDLKSGFKPVEDEMEGIDGDSISEDILSFDFGGKECERLKIDLNSFPQKDELTSILHKTSYCYRLAKKLAICVIEEKKLELRGDKDLFKIYHVALGKYVIERKKNSEGKEVDVGVFRDSFLNTNGSLPVVGEFKKVFHQAYQEVLKQKLKEYEFHELIKNSVLKLSSTFGKSANLHIMTSLPDDYIADSEMNCFFDKLVFAVNQPNETELGSIITWEMAGYEDINLIDSEFMASKLQKEILDWMKKKEGSFLTYEQGKELFDEIKQRISKLVLIGPTVEYRDKLEAFGIKFCKQSIELQNFLKSETEKIFNFISCYENITLSSIKVYQTLHETKQYKREDSYIFMPLSSLLRNGMQNHVKAASELTTTTNLLVIECDAAKRVTDTPFLDICQIIKLNIKTGKKVIFITQDNDDMLTKLKKTFFSNNTLIKEKKDEECTFVDLTEDSQKQLLKNSQVTFQGRNINLDKLVGKECQPILEKIKGELLINLINNEPVWIGKAAKDWKYDNVEPYCIARKFIRQIVRIAANFKDQRELFITIENEPPTEDISLLNQDIVIISNNDEGFKTICNQNQKNNIHWVKKIENEFEWKKTRGDLSRLRKFVDANGLNGEEIEPKKITDIPDRIVVIAAEPGMGKSIILSHLAMNTHSILPPIWIARSNLSDNVNKFNQWETKRRNISIKEAIIFLCEALQFQLFQNFKNEDIKIKENIMNEMLTIEDDKLIFNFLGKSQNDEVIFKTNEKKKIPGLSLTHMDESSMLEIELFIYFYNKGRIALLLDGFDEISPKYRKEGMELLLRALKLTAVDKIWVTTRPYNRIMMDIEDNLGTFAYSLKAFCSEKQGSFLKKFWEKNLNMSKLDEQRTQIFIHQLLNRFSESVNDLTKSFVGIPLQIYMIAEIFKDEFEKFHLAETTHFDELDYPVFSERLDLIYLYNAFLEKKLETANPDLANKKFSVPTINDGSDDDKNSYEKEMEKFKKHLENLAAYTLLRDILSKEEIDEVKDKITKIEEGKDKTGVINKIINEDPNFVHLTFAEYLSANYLWRKFNNIEIDVFEENFIKRIIINELIEKNEVQITKFFQLIAAKGLDHKGNIFNNIDKLKILLVNLLNNLKKCNIIHPHDIGKHTPSTSECTNLLLQIFESPSLLDDRTLELIVDIIECKEQYQLLCNCAKYGHIRLAKTLTRKLETKFLEQSLLGDYWENSPLWLAADNHHLDKIQILVEKYSQFTKPLMDVVGRTISHSILNDVICERQIGRDYFPVYNYYLKYNLIDCQPYTCHGKLYSPWAEAYKKSESFFIDYDSDLKRDLLDRTPPYRKNGELRLQLPIIEALKHCAPSDTIKLLVEKSDFDIVNNFKYCQGSKYIYFASLFLALEYDEEIVKNAVANGMDFSKAIYLLLYNYTKYNLRYSLSKYNTVDYHFGYSDYTFINKFFKKEFSYIHLRIKSLLKWGTGYNYKDDKYELTTIQMVKQIHNVHLLLIEVNKLCKFSNKRPLDLLLSLIIENIAKAPNFKGYKIIIDSTQISLLPIYEKDEFSLLLCHSLEYTKKINLPPNYMIKLLLKSHTNNSSEIIKEELTRLGTTVDKIKEIEKMGILLTSLPSYGEFYPLTLDLVLRMRSLFQNQGYSVDDAFQEIKGEIFEFEKILNRLKPMSQSSGNEDKLCNADEILGKILDTRKAPIDISQKMALTFNECGGIQIRLLIKIWLDLKNNLGQRNITKFLEEMITSSWKYHETLELFKILDASYNALAATIQNQKCQDMNKILQQSSNSEFKKSIINSQDEKLGSPLHYAVYKSDMKTIDCLLNCGANPNLRLHGELLSLNTKNYENWPPLHLAALNGHTEVVHRLLAAGSKTDAIIYATTIHEGESALHASTRSSANHSKIAQLLLQHGAKYDLKNARNQTPLDLAPDGSDIKELLNWIDQIFKNVENNNEDVAVSLLSKNNYEYDKIETISKTRNTEGLTLKQIAAANGETNIVRLMSNEVIVLNNQTQEMMLDEEASLHKTPCICMKIETSNSQQIKKICAISSHSLYITLNYLQQESVLENVASFYKIPCKDRTSLMVGSFRGMVADCEIRLRGRDILFPIELLIGRFVELINTDREKRLKDAMAEPEKHEQDLRKMCLNDASDCIREIKNKIFDMPARAPYNFDPALHNDSRFQWRNPHAIYKLLPKNNILANSVLSHIDKNQQLYRYCRFNQLVNSNK